MSAANDVFIGNLASNTTEEQLRDCFSVVGQISSVRLLVDKDTGRLKGFAFVEYASADSVNAAIRHLDKTELNGRIIKVSHASGAGGAGPAKSGTEGIIDSMPLHEVWDVLNAMKGMIEEHTAAELLETHPQLIGALTQAQKRLGLTN
jgi:RNA recognition motif-containing protein